MVIVILEDDEKAKATLSQVLIPFQKLEFSLGEKGLDEITEELEKKIVAEAMTKTKNNQTRAAKLLKITRGALQYKLKKYGFISSPAPQQNAA